MFVCKIVVYADQPRHRRSAPGSRVSRCGPETKRETVNEALREFIQRRQRAELVKLFDTVEYDPAYDYKKERRRR